MVDENLKKILESEDKAKQIISRAEEMAKKSMSDTIARKKEDFKREEQQLQRNTDHYLKSLKKDADEQVQALIRGTDEIISKTKASLEKHKSEMSTLVIEYITGKEKM